MKPTIAAVVLASGLAFAPGTVAAQTTPRLLYERAQAQERTVRETNEPTLQQVRSAVARYETLVHKYPVSGYTDNALWQAGNLALFAFDTHGQTADKRTALRLLHQLVASYPSSSLVIHAKEVIRLREASTPEPTTSAPAPVAAKPSSTPVMIRDVKRTTLPDGIRVSIEMDAELPYQSERLENPRRVFFDIKGARPAATLQDSSLKFQEDIVREIRFGRHPTATRVVMDMEGAESYSVFTLYDPFRIVVDFKRAAGVVPPPPLGPPTVITPPPPLALPPANRETPAQAADSAAPPDAKPVPSRPITAPSPTLPSANKDGSFSLARQLGLGVSRIVIDAGHGGHDPGAQGNGLSESELTLDVAQRLSRLLQKQPGVEVVMTRSTDVFIPLEERTAIANREGADLFLSIHANASRSVKAHGVETYYLNFAANPEAEATAARENSGSAQTMHRLPEIVKAIALNNKVDESRDFAAIVQRAMVRRLATRNKNLRDLGVKHAPFVVLIGAAMPSVLAEISFVTNKQEGALLKTGAYRQQIAEALFDAVVRYQASLKKMRGAGTEQSLR
jgi:N-acetylmuramoyl-L-alanine amidase